VGGHSQVWAVPDAPSKTWFSIFTCILYFADGAIFVGTPALVRDFSPQMQRGLAMGFWTLGPVAGYFVLSAVAQACPPSGTSRPSPFRFPDCPSSAIAGS